MRGYCTQTEPDSGVSSTTHVRLPQATGKSQKTLTNLCRYFIYKEPPRLKDFSERVLFQKRIDIPLNCKGSRKKRSRSQSKKYKTR